MLYFQDHFKGELAKTGALEVMPAYEAMLPLWPLTKLLSYTYLKGEVPIDTKGMDGPVQVTLRD